MYIINILKNTKDWFGSYRNPLKYQTERIYKTKIVRFFFNNYKFKENRLEGKNPEHTQKRLRFQILTEILKNARIKKGAEILDIGCGRGSYSILLGRRGYRVTGVDVSKKAINYAQNVLKKEIPEVRDRVNFENLAIGDLSYSNRFDFGLMFDVLEHLYPKDVNNHLEKISNALKQKGKLLIIVPLGQTYRLDPVHVVYYSSQKLKNTLLSQGFIVEKLAVDRRGDIFVNSYHLLKALAIKL